MGSCLDDERTFLIKSFFVSYTLCINFVFVNILGIVRVLKRGKKRRNVSSGNKTFLLGHPVTLDPCRATDFSYERIEDVNRHPCLMLSNVS